MKDRCDVHGLYLYMDGSVYTCKLGCKYEREDVEFRFSSKTKEEGK